MPVYPSKIQSIVNCQTGIGFESQREQKVDKIFFLNNIKVLYTFLPINNISNET